MNLTIHQIKVVNVAYITDELEVRRGSATHQIWSIDAVN